MTTRYVAYLRVSTAQQGQSGLGLDAQRDSIERFINGETEVIAWYTEVESGKNNSSSELSKALATCELTGANLVVATLSRLTRDEAFLRTIKDAGVSFQCADMPFADALVIDIMARLARYERERISETTKGALAAVKRRIEDQGFHVSRRSGNRLTRLGCPLGAAPLVPHRAAAAIKAGEGHRARADEWAEKRRGLFEELAGLSLNAAARELNKRHVLTRQKGQWSPMAVKRVRGRLGL